MLRCEQDVNASARLDKYLKQFNRLPANLYAFLYKDQLLRKKI